MFIKIYNLINKITTHRIECGLHLHVNPQKVMKLRNLYNLTVTSKHSASEVQNSGCFY